MKLLMRLAVAAAVIVTIPLIAGPPAQAMPALTYAEIAALPPQEQAAILDPLRAVADAASTVGTAAWSGIYSGVAIDAPAHRVTIYLTDPGRKADFLASARAADPKADLGLAKVEKGAYTLEALKAAAEDLASRQARQDLGVESVVVPADGSGLRVRAANTASAQTTMQSPTVRWATAGGATLLSSVPIVVEPAPVTHNLSRLRDTPQWIAGEAITQTSDGPGDQMCTSGLPARDNLGNRSFLITAAHCYPDGVTVRTGWEGGGRNTIGTVVRRNNFRDAIAIDTNATGATLSQEWDGPPGGPYNVFDVDGNSTGFSYVGDMTCQDGYTSGIVCGLKVTDGWVVWTGEDGVQHGGVEAHQVNGGIAARGGDSGGLVFALGANNYRQARGMVSAGNPFEGGNMVRWTEAPVILAEFGMHMAP